MLTSSILSSLYGFVPSDQMEFEAPQKAKAAQMNSKFTFDSQNKMTEKEVATLRRNVIGFFFTFCQVTEDQNDDTRYLGKSETRNHDPSHKETQLIIW